MTSSYFGLALPLNQADLATCIPAARGVWGELLRFLALLLLVACGAPEHEAPPRPGPALPSAPEAKASPEPTAQARPPQAEDDVVAPVVIKRVSPDLSKLGEVRALGVPIVELTISAGGDVTNVRFIRAVHPRIDAAIEEAVRQWKFRPATQNGRPVPSHMTLTVNIDWQ